MTEMMVQNSISQKPVGHKANSAKNRIPTPADYEKYQLGATAYEAKGHLVETPVWKLPVVAVEDTYQNIKNVGRGLKGQSNDHELGQMNDLGMKAGGLALAGYLATKRMLPTQKGMEFLGFASFFTSMALFPKLFINTPNKMVHGFNVDQKYVDSYGRKKSVYMDPQYTPYDLYAPEEIDAIGDKMGVDKDMENRQDFVKRKMSKIATQSNTIWMLTAGVATPIMGALMSNVIEKGVNKAQQAIKTQQINSKLSKLIENPNAALFQEQSENQALKNLLKNNQDKKVDDKFVDQLVKLMDKGSNLKANIALKQDLNDILTSNNGSKVSELLGEIKIEHPTLQTPIVFSKETIKQCLSEGNLNENININPETTDSIKKRLFSLVKAETKKYPSAEHDDLVTAINKKFLSAVDAKLKNPEKILTEAKRTTIQNAYKAMSSFNIKQNILAEYVDHRVGTKEDSIMARKWKASEGIMNAMEFSFKDLQEAKKSPTKAGEILDAKMIEFAKDDTKYKKVLGQVSKLINSFDESVEKGVGVTEFKAEVENLTNKLHNDFAVEARKSSLSNLANYVAGNTSEENFLPNSGAKNSIEAVDNRLLGARGSLYKVVQGLDYYKKLNDGTIKKAVKDVNENKDFVDQTIKAMRFALIEGTYDNHNVKFDIADPKVYKAFINNLFDPNLSESTTEVLGTKENGALLTKIQEHITEVRDQLGNAENRFLLGNKLDCDHNGNYIENNKAGKTGQFASKGDLKKQMMTGETFAQFVKKSAEQMGNTKAWLKKFALVGAGVGVVTLASTFFLGKIEPPVKKGKKEVVTNG